MCAYATITCLLCSLGNIFQIFIFVKQSNPWVRAKAVSETTNRSVNRQRESVATLVFFSNLEIDDNFRISNNLGLGLAANISTALALQPDRDREIEII